jgi:hypothetical protein
MSNTNTKTITIPKDRDPFVVIVNGVEYKYPAGETVTVPDSVADVIEKYENAKPKPDPNPAPGGSVQSDWNQNDSSAADFIKNKPFYEETTVVSEPLNITWDGNTEGLVSVNDSIFKISDRVLTDEEIKAVTITMEEASLLIGDVWGELRGSGGFVIDEMVNVYSMFVFVRMDNALLPGTEMFFPEAGIYAVTPCSLTKPETTVTERKTIDSKFLPEPIKFILGDVGKPVSCNISTQKLMTLSANEIKNRSICYTATGLGDNYYMTASAVNSTGTGGIGWSIIITFDELLVSYKTSNAVEVCDRYYVVITADSITRYEMAATS